MIQLSEEQLNNLGKEALVIIASSLQDQLIAVQKQLETANTQLADQSCQLEIFAEQLRIMNQRQFGKSKKYTRKVLPIKTTRPNSLQYFVVSNSEIAFNTNQLIG